jgi:hypothetical protein
MLPPSGSLCCVREPMATDEVSFSSLLFPVKPRTLRKRAAQGTNPSCRQRGRLTPDHEPQTGLDTKKTCLTNHQS